jgi:hypothetical protein
MLYLVPIDPHSCYLTIFTEPIIDENKTVNVPFYPKKRPNYLFPKAGILGLTCIEVS